MKHITNEQRYTIAVLLAKENTQAKIADIISVSKSALSREILRNKDQRNGNYVANLAIRKAEKRKHSKNKKIWFTDEIKKITENLLREDYSPEQITGYCKKNAIKHVSHERIYQHIWADKKKGGSLHEHLRRQGRRYRKRGASKDSRGIIKNRIDIDQRPVIVDKKERFGDLEIDTIIGKNHKGAIVTINDRASGFLWAGKVRRRTANDVQKTAVNLLVSEINLLHTITGDNGKEFALHEKIADQLKINFYFAKPYHSWERGANENTNGLLRQYIPKKTDFETVSDEYLREVVDKINRRPRKRLGYENPFYIKQELLI